MKKLLPLMFLLFLNACGESPLLNHKLEKNFKLQETAFSTADEFKFKQSGLSFNVDWSEPPRVGESKFNLKIWKTDTGTVNGPYVDPAQTLQVLLWMPAMGHGSAPVKVTKTAAGEYQITNVSFIMGGKWEVKFQLLTNGKVVDETVLTYTL